MCVRNIFVCIFLLYVTSVSGQGTNFVNQDSKLEGFFEPQWFKDNIPFIELPDKEIEDVYYYRWSSLKRHLRYTVPGAGYIVTEFVHKVGYSQKFDTINAAAGHHIYESRWLRNTRYVQDYINFWSREGGAAKQYSEWIADAAYHAFLVNGDFDFIKSQQAGLVNNFNDWDERFEPALGMYFLSPHDDAMEHSASSEQTDDPYHGGVGYRPSVNSELYANALAIAEIAKLNQDNATAEEFLQRASDLRRSVLRYLWDDERKFFYHMYREDNPNNELLDTREEIGFFPWRFGLPDQDEKYAAAWQELFENRGFETEYGPTTCEQRSQWYDGNQTSQCCWWNGNSWPYSTGFTINSLASQVKYYGITAFANVQSLVALLHKYAVTQHKNGKPYVAECHSPWRKLWVCDGFNHSEHYAHSTYTDNVLTDLFGVEPQKEDVFQINPLMLPSWSYFLVENIPYHGHNITVLYDRDGSRYQVGSGMQIFVNGVSAARQDQVGPMRVSIPSPIKYPNYDGANKMENYAANVNTFDYPMVDASFTSIHASVWHVVDGRIIYDHIPTNRWTNYQSPNPTDWFSVDFGPGRARNINQIKLYVYSDVATEEGVVDCFKSVTVEVQSGGNWVAVENQVSNPSTCIPNDVNIVQFNSVRTQKVRLVFTRDVANNYFVGLTEMEIWAPWPQANDGSYEAEDGYLRNANIHSTDSASGDSYVGQIDGDDASVEFTGVWIETPGEYDIKVFYANGGDASTMNIVVNNIVRLSPSFPPTGGWGQFNPNNFITVKVPLLRGNNVIIFNHGQNFAELDKIEVIV